MQSYETCPCSSLGAHRKPFGFFKASPFKDETFVPTSLPHHSQANHYISLIEDPLWKQVCIEFINMMGPLSILKIWNSRLEALSPHYKTIYIHCDTDEEADFIKKYSFIIHGCLQKYFPSIKHIKVKIKGPFKCLSYLECGRKGYTK